MTALDDVSLVQFLVNAGFKGNGTLHDALAVVFAESGARCDAHNTAGNRPPSTDRGLFQINGYWHREVNDACLCNAQAACRISNGGTNWHPWSTWSEAARRHYPDADRAFTAWRSGKPPLGSLQAEPLLRAGWH
jgi:Lysozyme like domain